MSFLSDKKKEHEDAAVAALDNRDFALAFAHTIKAAEYGLQLARQTEGEVSDAYIADANSLLDTAQKIKKQIGKAPAIQTEGQSGSGAESENSSSLGEEWLVRDKPNVKLDDVAGLEDVKQALREDIGNAIKHPELYRTFGISAGGGILLFGPPGTGKTFIAKAVAGELDAAFFSVSGSQIKDKYVGETEKNMRRLFEAADEHKCSVIFIDEAESILKKRSSEDRVSAVTDFLILADGLKERKNTLLLLGGTNNPWDIDPAVLRPGRFGKRIYVGLPDETARLAIFKLNLKGIPMDPYIKLPEFARRSDGYSGADIKGICERAKKKAIGRLIEDPSQEQTLLYSDLNESFVSTPPSVTKAQVQKYLDWQRETDE
ncbi:MAG: ATP-binding protein [Thermoguttaceae bacterium]|nr:ATP-binding protein [Thermoguttaceae bacterium]